MATVPSTTKSYVGVGKQTSKGTAVAPTKFVAYVDSVNLAHGMGITEHREAGNGPYVSITEKTQHDPNGRVTYFVRPDLAMALAAWHLGSDVIVGTGTVADKNDPVFTATASVPGSSGNPNTHYASPDEAAQTWLTVEQNADDQITERFLDALLEELTWEVSSGEGGATFLRSSASWQALAPSRESTQTAESYEADDPFHHVDAAYLVDGSEFTNVQRVAITLGWSFGTARTNAVTREELVKAQLQCTIELDRLISEAEYRKIAYGSASGTGAVKTLYQGSFDARFLNNGGTDATRTHQVRLPQVDWSEPTYTELNPGSTEIMVLSQRGVATKSSEPLVEVRGTTPEDTTY